jgi:hypothetical protein
VVDQRDDDRTPLARLDAVDGVQHEQHGVGAGRQRPQRAVALRSPRGRAGRLHDADEVRSAGQDTIERGDGMREEDDRIVVALVAGQPGDRPRVGGGPLREQRRLPVARWSDDEDDAGVSLAEPLDQRRARDRLPLGRRGPDLGFDDRWAIALTTGRSAPGGGDGVAPPESARACGSGIVVRDSHSLTSPQVDCSVGRPCRGTQPPTTM